MTPPPPPSGGYSYVTIKTRRTRSALRAVESEVRGSAAAGSSSRTLIPFSSPGAGLGQNVVGRSFPGRNTSGPAQLGVPTQSSKVSRLGVAAGSADSPAPTAGRFCKAWQGDETRRCGLPPPSFSGLNVTQPLFLGRAETQLFFLCESRWSRSSINRECVTTRVADALHMNAVQKSPACQRL